MMFLSRRSVAQYGSCLVFFVAIGIAAYRIGFSPLVAAEAEKPMVHTPSVTSKEITFGTVKIDNLNIAYREAGDTRAPKLVLLHGFPASSHQYRNLIRALSGRFHVIAPD